MNTKQILLCLSGFIALNAIAMEETDAQKARRLRAEAIQKTQTTLPATIPTTPLNNNSIEIGTANNDNNAPAPVPNNNVPAQPAQPRITKPTVLEGLYDGLSDSEIAKDMTRKEQLRKKRLDETTAQMHEMLDRAQNQNVEEMAGFIFDALTGEGSREKMEVTQKILAENLEYHEAAYANDPEFEKINNFYSSQLALYEVIGLILANPLSLEIWSAIDAKYEECIAIAISLEHDQYAELLGKYRAGYQIVRDRVLSDPKAQIQMEREANAERVATILDEDEAQKIAQAELEDELLAQALHAEARPDTSNDALLAASFADEVQSSTANDELLAAALAQEVQTNTANDELLARELANENQAPVHNTQDDELLARQMAEQLREEEERASMEAIRRMQEEWNREQ